MEHVVLCCLQNYMEEDNLLSPAMLGFRAHVSTQDALVQLHLDLLRSESATSTKALLSLDLHKAFDNMKHNAIVNSLANGRTLIQLHMSFSIQPYSSTLSGESTLRTD